MLAGIQDIPDSYYESAKIDGASTLRQVLPLHRRFHPTISSIWLSALSLHSSCLTSLYILTREVRVNLTVTVAMLIFQNAFQYGKMGYASCIAWCLFIVIMDFHRHYRISHKTSGYSMITKTKGEMIMSNRRPMSKTAAKTHQYDYHIHYPSPYAL